jgi:hypothetical protein
MFSGIMLNVIKMTANINSTMHDVFIVSVSISDINDTECHYGECRGAIKRVDKTKAKKSLATSSAKKGGDQKCEKLCYRHFSLSPGMPY